MSDKDDGDISLLKQEVAYYKRSTDELAGENLKLDYTVSGLRHELKQKREALTLLSALHESIGTQQEVSAIFRMAINSINSTLGMDKSIVLFPDATGKSFRPGLALGPGLDESMLKNLEFEFPPEIVNGTERRIVTKSTAPDPLNERIKQAFELPFFIISAVRLNEQALGIFISGRQLEAKPLYPPLDKGDIDTFNAISGLISATVETMKVASLKETDRLKTEFFANISHEFRTPITLTIGPLEAMINGRYGEVSERIQKEIEIVLRNQRRLLDLINQLLDLAKMESGAMRLEVHRIADVNKFVSLRVEQFQAMAEKRGLKLVQDFDPALASSDIYFNPDQMDKVIFNLLSNAHKFTNKGSITVKTALIGADFKISVADTGMGIRADQVGLIFDRFKQADGSASREYSGTGIGLSLLKQVVELHGGSVKVESEYGSGSTFSVTLPVGKGRFAPETTIHDEPFEDAGTATQNVSEGREGRATKNERKLIDEQNGQVLADATDERARFKRILYADDNPDLREFVFKLLSREFNVFVAVDGEDGFAKAKQYGVDLIISDLMMPVMTGTDFLKKVREEPITSAIPFVLLTAKGGTDTKVDGLERGADDFVAKPFSEAELLARVKNLLKIREQQQRIKRDLLAAREIQQSLLPKSEASFGDFAIHVLYKPCDELSGDFFEYQEVNGKVYFYVADVTSHGTAAAQVTYLLKGIFRNILSEGKTELSASAFVELMTKEYVNFKLSFSVGLCFGIFDLKANSLEYLTSNFPPGVRLFEKAITALAAAPNPVIDAYLTETGAKFSSSKLDLRKDESIYFFTDGCYEFEVGNMELGWRRFSKLVLAADSANWPEKLIAQLSALNGGDSFEDDITIFRISRN